MTANAVPDAMSEIDSERRSSPATSIIPSSERMVYMSTGHQKETTAGRPVTGQYALGRLSVEGYSEHVGTRVSQAEDAEYAAAAKDSEFFDDLTGLGLSLESPSGGEPGVTVRSDTEDDAPRITAPFSRSSSRYSKDSWDYRPPNIPPRASDISSEGSFSVIRTPSSPTGLNTWDDRAALRAHPYRGGSGETSLGSGLESRTGSTSSVTPLSTQGSTQSDEYPRPMARYPPPTAATSWGQKTRKSWVKARNRLSFWNRIA